MTTPRKIMSPTEAMNRAKKMDLTMLAQEAPKSIYQIIYIASQHLYSHFLRHKDEKMRLDACKYVMDLLKDKNFLESLKFLTENLNVSMGNKGTVWQGELGKKVEK